MSTINITNVLVNTYGQSAQAFNYGVAQFYGSFTSFGGPLLIFVSGSGYCDSSGSQTVGMNVEVDATLVGSCTAYSNNGLLHVAFVPAFLPLNNFAAGQHTITLSAMSTTAIDQNDPVNATVIEITE